jgi:predicted nucleic acid-binding protein
LERQFDTFAINERDLMILVDTSVWIDFFRAKRNKSSEILFKAIENAEDICTSGIIMTEVLQGIRADTEYYRIKTILLGLIYLPVTKNMFIQAASIYRALRKQGKTIRSPIDCIIAAICLEHEVNLLHNDRDFISIARVTPLKFAK